MISICTRTEHTKQSLLCYLILFIVVYLVFYRLIIDRILNTLVVYNLYDKLASIKYENGNWNYFMWRKKLVFNMHTLQD